MLTVSAVSSNTALVPNANVVLGGAGADRTVTITPVANASGTTAIVIAVGDGAETATETFVVTVNAMNDGPTITDIGDQTVDEDGTTMALPFTISDIETPAATLTVSGTSSNTALVPDANVVFGGAGTDRTVTITPAANASGTTTILITIADGTTTATDTFTVTVNAANDAPTITNITDRTVNEDVATTALPFIISDAETPAAMLTVSGASSNTALVPNANVVLGGTGTARTVKITPAANASGMTTIMITVGDGTTTAMDTFTVTVNAVNDAPTISATADQMIAENTATGALAFTISDVETAPAALTVSGVSSNQTLVPNANILFGGAGGSRTVTVASAPGESGTVAIAITVGDGVASARDLFVLTVIAASEPPVPPSPTPPRSNDPPAVSGLANTTMEENATVTSPFTIRDDSTPADALTVLVTSSNPALVPASAIVLGGSGESRTIQITPRREGLGQSTITVTVSDGEMETVVANVLTVVRATSPPLPPVLVSATWADTLVTLVWTTAGSGPAPAFFAIEGGTAPGATTLPAVQTPATNTWHLTLPPGWYYFRVRAGNRVGTSDASNELGTQLIALRAPASLPGPPSGLVITVDRNLVTASWQPPVIGGPVRGWQLELESGTDAFDSQLVRIPPGVLQVSDVLADGFYVARIRAVNAAGEGPASNDVTFRVGVRGSACEVPDAPVLLPATVAGDRLTIVWRAPRNTPVSRYLLFGGSAPGLADLAIIDVGSVTSFSTTIAPGIYYVMIEAANACGISARSTTVVIVTTTMAPPAPQHVTATVLGDNVVLNWEAVAGASSYLVDVGIVPGASHATFPTAASNLAVRNVASGVYYVRVRAVGRAGASAPSVELVIVVP